MSNITLRAAPLPTNFKGTPQQLFDAMLARMEITSDASTISVADTAPSSNVGPWLKAGTKWYVWDVSTANPSGAYVPVDISDSLNDEVVVAKEDPENAGAPFGIGSYEEQVPPKVPPRIWLQTDAGGTRPLAIWYNFGGNLGWVKGPSVITSVEASAIVPPADRANYLLAVSEDGASITTRSALIARVSNPTAVDAGKVVTVKQDGTGFELGTVNVADVWLNQTNSAAISTANSLLQSHGLGHTPRVRAVLVCSTADTSTGYAVNDEVNLSSFASYSDHLRPTSVVASNASNVWAAIRTDFPLTVLHKTDFTQVTIDPAKWTLKAYWK